MDMLKKFWPTPFKVQEKDVASLIIQLVIFLVVCVVAGWLISLLALIPIINIIAILAGSLLEIYGIVGIVLCVLKFLGLVK